MKTGVFKLIAKVPGYERYVGTKVNLVKIHREDDLEEGLSRMFLVQLIDGKIITVFEDELEEIG